ncbi:hypothetical protein DICPUDRAFT_58841 [Dictyostelium purpureum]|uniref:Alpha-galactosidase n=1 Tax=Dictyostelium purpureum TaxID=5786 RepID=F1A365_DICPU|nr:uncharacterized protein DICPUDRAFT_58841 [Dictyostelium purpureum]EGC29366.1 hypothetical protein DICPUDRAFT_58841 [Dictyostelium purpureum]|eukprot:XP_003294110.1 hypothetical protein DICPUDRAFT_58841 [Dictyostelium purpureum]
MKLLLSLILIINFFCFSFSLDNGLALTPIMAWNPWNKFGCETSLINETMFMEMAYAMASNGMANAGYQYINLDDCWFAKTRDNVTGQLIADPVRFPRGIGFLATYIHSLGLKFGIYGDIGTETCMGYPGSAGYLELDAKTFAEWGVDYVKMDGCNYPEDKMQEAYTQLGQYLKSTNRPMVYSCSWPTYAYVQNISMPFNYIEGICNLWREFQDITDNFDEWVKIIDEMEIMKPDRSGFAGPGHWNDPDMLEIGNGNQTNTEYKSMFSLWAILAAPLVAGNDLRTMDQETLDILINTDVIAVNQDPLGIQGSRVNKNGNLEIWKRPLVNNSIAVALFNRGPTSSNITITNDILNITNNQNYNIMDLWTHTSNGTFYNSFTAMVPSHGTVLIKLSPIVNEIVNHENHHIHFNFKKKHIPIKV